MTPTKWVAVLAMVPAALLAQSETRTARIYADVFGRVVVVVEAQSTGHVLAEGMQIPPGHPIDTAVVAVIATTRDVDEWARAARQTLDKTARPPKGESVSWESPALTSRGGSTVRVAKRIVGTKDLAWIRFDSGRGGRPIVATVTVDAARDYVSSLVKAAHHFTTHR